MGASCCSSKKVECAELNEDLITAFLKDDPEFAKDWYITNIGIGELKELADASERHAIKRASISTGDEETTMFLEIIREIAKELNVNALCHKILMNVKILTKSDRASLFLARGTADRRYLVPILFSDSDSEDIDTSVVKEADQFHIEFGSGIAGMVAETKCIINVTDAYQDNRFNKDIDKKTGYHTKAILCMPILDYEGKLLGVAQIINKKTEAGVLTYNENDEELFGDYLSFCGIGLANAELFEMAVREERRNTLLLQLARKICEEQNNLDKLLINVMTEAKELTKSERCHIYLTEAANTKEELQSTEDIIFTKLYKLDSNNRNFVQQISAKVDDTFVDKIAKETILKGESHCIDNNDPRYASLLASIPDMEVTCLMNMPIKKGNSIIGVMQFINKTTHKKEFSPVDIINAEAFGVFCGLGLHNCQTYEDVFKLMAKQSVALEILSYHASASAEDTDALKGATLATAEEYNLYSWDFDDSMLTDDETCKVVLCMFLKCKVTTKFGVPYEVLCRWLLSVKKKKVPTATLR